MCIGHILNGLSDSLFDAYQNKTTAKELWDKLEARYMTEDANSKKFLVSRFNSYQVVIDLLLNNCVRLKECLINLSNMT